MFSVIELIPDPDHAEKVIPSGWCEFGFTTLCAAEDHAENLRLTYGGRYEVVGDSDELA